MAKITTNIEISEGNSSVSIDANGLIFFSIGSFYLNDIEPDEITQRLEDLENVIEVFKKHITDRH